MPDFRFEVAPDTTSASTPRPRVNTARSIHAAATAGIFARSVRPETPASGPLPQRERGAIGGSRSRQLAADLDQAFAPWKVTTLCALFLVGCASHNDKPAGTVATAWAARDSAAVSPSTEYRPRSEIGVNVVAGGSETPDTPLAYVDGQPIGRNRVVELLLRSHGVGVLEQLIGLELAARSATEQGLGVTQADVDIEFDLALRRLSDPLSRATSGPFDRAVAEGLLDAVLAERNISREEFFVTLRRNAYLRKIVESRQEITEDELRAEFDRRFGERVQVQHIQLASAAEAGRVQDRLAAGEDFGDLASRYSANSASARQQGLLDPFSADDEKIPAAFRQAAFALKPGQVSHVVRIGEWYHLLKLERMLPAENRDFDAARGGLERELRVRVSETKMRELYEALFKQATIEVRDPAVREAFERKHGGRTR